MTRTWRVTQVPRSVTKDELRKQIEGSLNNVSCVTGTTGLIQIDLAPITRGYACATITLECALPKELNLKFCIDDLFIGVTPLYEGKNATVDVIAVPGLGSHALGSFRSSDSHHVWLRDFLPRDVPNIRMLLYGYDTKLLRSSSKSSIRDLSRSFLESMRSFRMGTGTSRRPIVFICHSLGGLVIKEALCLAGSLLEDRKIREFSLSSYGILFFGVPNLGLNNERLRTMVAGQSNAQFIHDLVVDKDFEPSPYLKELNRKFIECCKSQQPKYEIISYYERRESPTIELMSDGTFKKTGPPCLLVTEESAIRVSSEDDIHKQIPLETDHSGLVKFPSHGHWEYDKVQSRISELVDSAPQIVARRFDSDHGASLPPSGLETKYEPPLPPPPPPPPTSKASTGFREFLNSLLFQEVNDRRFDITTASEKTVNWLIQNPEYISWQASQRALLWIKGKPGSGKSTLIKFAIEREEQTPEQQSLVLMTFFFNARGVQLQRTQLGLLRSLLYQLVIRTPALHSRFLEHCQHKSDARGNRKDQLTWRASELRSLLQVYTYQALRTSAIKIYIDALDECSDPSADDVASFFIHLLSISATQGRLQICITCRHYPIISSPGNFRLTVEEQNAEAIKLHVGEALKSLSIIWQSEDMKAIKCDILEKASGVFQWVSIALRIATTLKDGRNPQLIRKRIGELPSALDDLYTRILQGVAAQDRYQAISLIRWICFAEEPLSLSAMRFAIAFDTDLPDLSLYDWKKSYYYVGDDEQMRVLITSLSGGLAEVRNKTDKVQFIHESVNDYVKSRGFSALDGSQALDILGKSHNRLMKSCINFFKTKEVLIHVEGIHKLQLSKRGSHSQIYGYTHFLEYIAFYWSKHLLVAEEQHCLQSDLLDLLNFPSDRIFRAYINFTKDWAEKKIDAPLFSSKECSHILHFMCKLNIISVVRTLLERYKVQADLKNENEDTPLIVASRYGHKRLVRHLLHHCIINVNAQNRLGETALHVATDVYQSTIAQLLLDFAEVNVNLQDTRGRVPLHNAASGHGHRANSIVAALLNRQDIHVNATDNEGWTPLFYTAETGNEAVARRLLSRREIELNMKDSFGRTSLMIAIRNGHKTISILLITLELTKVDVPGTETSINRKGTNFSRPSSQNLGSEILPYHPAQIMSLPGGVDINAQDKDGFTALHLVVLRKDEKLLEALLARDDIDVLIKDSEGSTAMDYCTRSGWTTGVQMLLREGIGVRAPTKDFDTAFVEAI